MSAELIVKFCAPTLAGLKVANLFSYKYQDKTHLEEYIENYNKTLNHKGVYFEVLKITNKSALIYVYRKNKLNEILKRKDIQEFLYSYGYNKYDEKTCFELLKARLINSDFPHEIGVFLGYPLKDTKLFIKHKGSNFKYVGYWKVYTNEKEAKDTFFKFDKCTKIYHEKFKQGTQLTRLAIAI